MNKTALLSELSTHHPVAMNLMIQLFDEIYAGVDLEALSSGTEIPEEFSYASRELCQLIKCVRRSFDGKTIIPDNFRVNWSIDSNADTAEEAAIEARQIQRDGNSAAQFFEVIDKKGTMKTIDLMYN